VERCDRPGDAQKRSVGIRGGLWGTGGYRWDEGEFQGVYILFINLNYLFHYAVMGAQAAQYSI
jgi:hypothetical protein